ncbi:hypothetical protein Hbl1158_15865 (plasmid) [Halobaculum sp. CBA1158]|uniref:hypothetical protein n=1 Tax=Halobaculum sp. CBA1158 TaxID=2904243 RepID=UPI001F28FD02|nr:hypothetical protein [Halobaculum sp. CBA1158]UIP01384.1 hypothetical protein Hbl1158_15865 [Halobaculum sp. CBA1158]
MASSDGDRSPVTEREQSPLTADEKREMIRELDRTVRYGSTGLETSTWATLAGCTATFVLAGDDRIAIRLRYDESSLPGPVTVEGDADGRSSSASNAGPPTRFIDLSPAHEAVYEDLTDVAGRAVDPYAVTVPDSPLARRARDGTVTFDATLERLTGEASAEPRTFEWG